ncbi:MAG: hypothetical protein AB8G05_24695 [Oligoflexales bacterium]
MEQHRLISIFLFSLLCITHLLAGTSCSDESAKTRQIRAHSHVIEGIPHAIGLNHAERYCRHCHGVGLSGGKDLEPSCYTCHGKKWLDSDSNQVHAPTNHTNQYGHWFHDPNHGNAEASCSSCHGENLEGEINVGVPSCFLCHEKTW